MEAKAHARYVRVTPQKARRIVNEIRNKPVLAAADMLQFAPQRVARDVQKLLFSAVANIEELAADLGESVQESDLWVVEAYVDEGPTMKRFRPRAQGSAGAIMKRTSHITVIVGTKDEGGDR